MTIEALINIVAPPATPSDPYDGPWDQIEARLGSALPQDYKDFVRVYGQGLLFDSISINTPKSNIPYTRLGSGLLIVRDVLSSLDEPEYPLWPDPGGLICFGGTDFSDYFFWLPEGDPNDWKVVAIWRGELYERFEVFDCSLTEFLAGIATGDVDSRYLPARDDGPYEFVPFSSWPDRGIRWKWSSNDDPDAS